MEKYEYDSVWLFCEKTQTSVHVSLLVCILIYWDFVWCARMVFQFDVGITNLIGVILYVYLCYGG